MIHRSTSRQELEKHVAGCLKNLFECDKLTLLLDWPGLFAAYPEAEAVEGTGSETGGKVWCEQR